MTDKTYQTTLLIRGDAKNAVRSVQLTRSELEKLTGAQGRQATFTQRLGGAWDKTNAKVTKASRSFSGLQGAITALGLGKLISETIQASNTYASLQGQLKLVTGSQKELNQVYDRALALANATGQSTEATVKLYARMARSTEELNLSQDQLFTITEAVNKSFVVSGATAQEAASATLQLSQGLAAGALRGEELNSVMENSPRLARALADGLGVTIGQLREMGKAGELSGEAVTQALLKTAHTIEDEFQQMPMTIGRVWQTLTNDVNDALGKVDTGPMIDAVEELREVMADPQFKQSVTDIASGLISMTAAAADAMATMVPLTKFIAEEFNAAINGAALDDIPRMEDELHNLEKRLDSSAWMFLATADRIKEVSDRAYELRNAIEDQRKGLIESNRTTGDAADAHEELSEIVVTATRRHLDFGDATDKLREKTSKYIKELEFEHSLMKVSERQRDILIAQRKAGSAATQEEQAHVAELTGALWDASVAEEALTEIKVTATKKRLDTSKLEAEQTKTIWDEALVGMAERIDTEFSGAWRDALDGNLDSFKDFGRALLDSAKQMLAELLHLNLTRPLVQSVAGMFGLGSSTSSVAGGSGSLLSSVTSGAGSMFSGGLPSGISNFATGGFNGLSGAYQGIGNFASDLGFDGIANSAYGAGDQYLNASNWSNLGNLGLNIGAGFAGNWAGNQVFGESKYGGVGGSIGGAIGSIWGPLGTMVGSFIGNGLGSLVGGKNRSDKSAYDIDFATGAATYSNRGHDMDEAAQGLVDVLLATAETIGGSSANFQVQAHGEHGLGIVQEDGTRQSYGEDYDAFFNDSFDLLVKGADNLSQSMKVLLINFDGTAEEIGEFATAMVSISNLSNINSVSQAIEDFTIKQESLAQTYDSSGDRISTLIQEFDGSSTAASALSAALATNKAHAYEFAIAIQQIGQSIAVTAEEQARSFRDSLLTEEELYASRKEEIKALREGLSSLTDPEEIQRTTARLLELNRERFNEMTEEQQTKNAEWLARFAENTNIAAQRALDNLLTDMQQTQDDINTKVNAMLRETAQKHLDAAEAQSSAVQDFGYWVDQLSRTTAPVYPPSLQGSEVI